MGYMSAEEFCRRDTEEVNNGDSMKRGGGDRWRRTLYNHYWEYEGSRHTAGE
jgi:hypothetical protein